MTSQEVNEKPIVIRFDYRPNGTYISAECQFGAHWACPGSLRTSPQEKPLRCQCAAVGCTCAQGPLGVLGREQIGGGNL